MSQNIKLKGDWSNVPAVNLPKAGGGTAKFIDPSPTTAIDSDVAAGKIYFKANGDQSTGTGSGGGGTINLQSKSKSYTPTETAQSENVLPDSGYDGLSSVSVSVGAISSTYVGSGITRRTSADMSEAQGTITAPAGYYQTGGTFNMTDVGIPSPTITFNSSTGLITATHTQPEGWTQGDTTSATRQLTTYQATSFTPTSQDEVIIPAGSYCAGAITMLGTTIPAGSTTITANGTYDVTDFEDAIVNVASSGGLEYETGTWEPTSDIARGSISFSGTHADAPKLVLLADVTGTAHSATSSNYVYAYVDPEGLFGVGFPYTSSGFRYVVNYYSYRNNSTSNISSSALVCSHTSSETNTTANSYPRYWVTNTGFNPYSNSSSRYWRAGRTYKWIAVWAPTT